MKFLIFHFSNFLNLKVNQTRFYLMMMMMMMMIMMMNCFCGLVDQRKAFSLISSQDHCQRSSPLQISDMPQAGFEPAQNLSLGLVEWSCAVVITTTPQCHMVCTLNSNMFKTNLVYTAKFGVLRAVKTSILSTLSYVLCHLEKF